MYTKYKPVVVKYVILPQQAANYRTEQLTLSSYGEIGWPGILDQSDGSQLGRSANKTEDSRAIRLLWSREAKEICNLIERSPSQKRAGQLSSEKAEVNKFTNMSACFCFTSRRPVDNLANQVG